MCLNMYSIFQRSNLRFTGFQFRESSFDGYDGEDYVLPDWGPAEKGNRG